jgi:uroporphyrinogen-III synthase
MTEFPLQGLHIINTRPKHQAPAWSQPLRAMGATVSELPAIEIKAIKPNWESSVLPLEQFDQLIFVSANAVHFFFLALTNQQTLSDKTQVSAVGQQTAYQLEKFSVNASYPTMADSEHLLAMPHFQQVKNQHILIIKGVGGRPLLAQTLRQRGAQVQQVNVYKRCCPKPMNNLDELWQDQQETIILVTSTTAIDNLFHMMPDYHPQLLQTTWLAHSKRIATYAMEKGVKHVIISDGEDLYNTLLNYQQGLGHDR